MDSNISEANKLHIVMFPWLAFGHISPFLELSKLIAQKGHKVSFVSTPRNIDRLPKLPPNLAPLINLVKLPLPKVDNLPQNAEATMDIPYTMGPYLKKACDGLREALANFLETMAPDWIVYDFTAYWLPPIAAKLGISRAYFGTFSASSQAFFGPASAMLDGSKRRTKPEHFTVVPKWVPFDSTVKLRLYEVMKIFDGFKKSVSDVTEGFRLGSVIMGCDVFLIRSCEELESDWLKLLAELHQKPIVPVGLLPPSVQDSMEDRDDTWLKISEWLDMQNRESVVYVALGSEVTPRREELTELALGLELSGLPFFWALRKQPGSVDCDSVELPQGFEERTKGRGIVWMSWVPQIRILAHNSVGGFLTHCGWSSIIEGLQHGHALVMLPFFGDQGLNARAFEEKKLGLEIPRNELDGSFTRNLVSDSLRLVTVEEGGRIYRDKAKEMKAMFRDKDLHDRYVENLVSYLEIHRRLHKG